MGDRLRPGGILAHALVGVALTLGASGCGISRVGRLFLAEMAFAAVTTVATHYDGSLDQSADSISDREYVCVTDDGVPLLLPALGVQAAATRCRHRQGRECECRPRAEFARTMRTRDRLGFADDPWTAGAEQAEAAHRLGRPTPGRATSTSTPD